NSNNVLYEFVKTGVYRAGLSLHQTISPSMDILVSSNLERLLYHLSGNDAAQVSAWMEQQKRGEDFTVSEQVKAGLDEEFCWGWTSDEEAKQKIGQVFAQNNCLIYPHSAVGYAVYENLCREGALSGQTVVLCTASPFKFAASVLAPLGVTPQGDGCDGMLLSEASGRPAPEAIEMLWRMPVLHTGVVTPDTLKNAVLEKLADPQFGC
ncbi:MAG: threonine synthase, partial [Clostridia bacterium]|nr:threonine synthase [Clostridia bacterium]